MWRRHRGQLLVCLLPCAAACDVTIATGVTLRGLQHFDQYNGRYSRAPRVHTVHDQPTFWQEISTSQQCEGALTAGACFAQTWTSLPAGNASAEECLRACEAERTNGCCRYNKGTAVEPPESPGWAEPYATPPSGCALGHGRTVYDPNFDMAGVSQARVTKCSGQAFLFYCAASASWQLAPPSAWDVIDQEQCYDKVTGMYRHSLAIGPEDGTLGDGFTREWGVKLWPATYVAAQATITFLCPGDDEPESPADTVAANSGPSTGAHNESSSSSDQSIIIAIGVGVGGALCLALVGVMACRFSNGPGKSAEAAIPGAVMPEDHPPAATQVVMGRPVPGSAAKQEQS